MDKKGLIKILQKNPEKYWYLDFFRKNGWKRKQCRKCGKFFWTLKDQDLCNDSSCRPYEFIGNPLTRKEFDYFSMWKAVRKFFESEGHAVVDRYPVLCRWFPDLYFTIAGVVDFYRKDGNKFVFELPENPVLILQPSLRFNDIPQVGVSGRHWTCHSHLEQGSLADERGGYWKERCIELDYRMLTEVLGIKKERINFVEDAWLGPGAFGYSLEYHVGGLEMGNAVFTEFRGTPGNYRIMKNRLIDMGAGFDRFVWISQGTPTNYDAILGSVLEKMKKKAGLKYERKLFEKYSKLAGLLNMDEVEDIEKAKEEVAKSLGISKNKMNEKIEPLQALYAVADHTKALLFAVTDGGIPSNMGGGYNLRVILRRTLSFIKKYNLPFGMEWVAEEIGRYFKPLYPELGEKMEHFKKVVGVEKEKYEETSRNTRNMLDKMIEGGENISEEKMIELYDSHGITPETVGEIAEKNGLDIEIPPNIYQKVTERHESEKKKKKKHSLDEKQIRGLEETPVLFYKDIYNFEARVLRIMGDYVVLDKTAFYPRSGGQESDIGKINGFEVFNVEKIDKIIVHQMRKNGLKVGDVVKCEVDKVRRKQIMQHHTTTHIINASARIVLGDHVWQGGSKKDVDKAHLDISHYRGITEKEVNEIERNANEIVGKNYKIKKEVLPRPEAEKKYGFRIYQGAAVPSKVLRIVSIDDIEHEACGGTHLEQTKDAGKIVILRTEKPHDGIVRISYVSGKAADKYLEKCDGILQELEKILKVPRNKIADKIRSMREEWRNNRKRLEKLREKKVRDRTEKLEFEKIGKYRVLIKELEKTPRKEMQKISMKLTGKDTIIFLFGLNEKIDIFASAGKNVKSDVGKIVKKIAEDLGGSGGGSPKLGQGFGLKKDRLGKVKENIRKKLGE
ncbi:MAG: alanine--tRNA ligase [archaeon]|nr:MAG: alanine--tRNA ligase [archaeon]